jgi:hypothetical protein
MTTTWRNRLPLAHSAAVGLLVLGLGLAGRDMVTSVGVAAPARAWITTWWECRYGGQKIAAQPAISGTQQVGVRSQ